MGAGSDVDDLLAALEQAFGVSIPIGDAEKMRTVGDLLHYLRDKLAPRVNVGCLTMQTFFRLRTEVTQTLGVARSLVRPQSKIEDIIPPKDRRKFWKQLKKAGLEPPNLAPSKPVGCVGMGAIFGLLLCLCLLCWYPSAILMALIVLLGMATYMIHGPLAIYPRSCRTVGELALHLTPARNGSGPCGMTDQEINEKACLLIADELCLPIGFVTDNAKFVEDLKIQ